MTTVRKSAKTSLAKPQEKKLTPAQKKRVDIIKKGVDFFSELYQKGKIKPYVKTT